MLQHWHDVRVAHVEATGGSDTPQIGSTLDLRAEVELPGLTPGGGRGPGGLRPGRRRRRRCTQVTCLPMKHEHTDGSRHWFTATVPLERTGAFGYTVRVLPHSEHLADPAELGVVTSA